MDAQKQAIRELAYQLYSEKRESRALEDWLAAEHLHRQYSTSAVPDVPTAPARLFKYVGTAPHHFAILENLEIRFTQPSSLNDPRDCRPNVIQPEDIPSTVDQIFARNIARYPKPLTPDQITRAKETYLRSYVDNLAQRIEESATILRRNLERIGVLSLAAVADDVVMWAHYAENHRGFVIEFNTGHAPLTQRSGEVGWQGRPVPVAYRESRVQVRCDSANLEVPDEVVLFKTSAWQYEREWRVVRDRTQASRTLLLGGTEISLFSISPEAISAVYVGSDASVATETQVRDALARHALGHVRIVRAAISVQGDVIIP